RTEHGVQNKLQRGVDFPPVSPDADEEVHRNQHHFPEQEKEEKVQRAKNADHAGFEHQQNDEEADAVDAHVVVNLEAGNPVVKLLEPIAAVAQIESAKQKERQDEFDDGRDQREAANPNVVVAFEQEQCKHPKNREERQHRQDEATVLHYRTI